MLSTKDIILLAVIYILILVILWLTIELQALAAKVRELKDRIPVPGRPPYPPPLILKDPETLGSKPETPTNNPSPNITNAPPCPFPDEILWHIFTHYLLITEWKGWTTLILLNRRLHSALMNSPLLIRRTLPPAYGGLFPTIQHLLTKLESARDTRKIPITIVLDAVLSAIRYTEQETWVQIGSISHSISSIRCPNIGLFHLAQNASQSYVSFLTQAHNWQNLMIYMKSVRESKAEEYQRFKQSLIEIFSRYEGKLHVQWFTKDFLFVCHFLGDEDFLEDIARVGKYTVKEIQDRKRLWKLGPYNGLPPPPLVRPPYMTLE
ncbi:hypothetical protein HDV00_007364 [Rhizophlyctis rosea]|nr:hypothetical protein HDV00_007364 [Rhizophlyctis rosea]